MKKIINEIRNVSKNIQEKMDYVATWTNTLDYVHDCIRQSENLREFYKRLKENPDYTLYESNGVIQGVFYKNHPFLFKDLIPKEYKLLVWNQLSYEAEKQVAKDNDLTR
ncbi:hypothetical protein [Tenacibaculum agarivorans]|uniref:hypothetical protein n=1 Tax=Tenacibaculum agarivorans TaxID=1908389 RepID=UPI00094B9DD0|nr:hypothetical protein [Tenacibaculum agarivorans]